MKLINWALRFEINMSGLNKFHTTTIPENICREERPKRVYAVTAVATRASKNKVFAGIGH
jgi:hypothetical protein